MKLVAALAALVLAAPSAQIDLLHAFRTQLPVIRRASAVPILLPHVLPVLAAPRTVYATGGATPKGWHLELAAAPKCGGADACFVASFEAVRGGRLPARSNLRLPNGDPAFYHPIGCGASCSPASLWFVHRGVLYSWQVKEPPRDARVGLARLAAEAITAGPR